ncbi:RNA exonuclease 4 [Heterostelium album PN500]|uniref:RNA exonuclease 4 n=1 Tax=Heterostelium pallidum (strain ATCC 26659 / Pp 5 / PN500) TaxID=670386 RepID=D3BRU0_HETP5|nr:RNA exonuclease 4 [Heterostelium album PN500]EFA76122.1 RNA exonuclease 4 [Heterostelium album PN500]|eukprot:XP_020428256.1 RNA exonuclease 4 [Heterostelium album PN500]
MINIVSGIEVLYLFILSNHDCEMVEVEGRKEALGSVCIVNSYGNTIYKSYAKPESFITNYRTRWSGLTYGMLERAPPAASVKRDVAMILRNKIVVGHNLQKDFQVLDYQHDDPERVRDSYCYEPLMSERDIVVKKKSSIAQEQSEEDQQPVVVEYETVKRLYPQALKKLAKKYLAVDIQTYEHSAEEDSLASMMIYNKHSVDWESLFNRKNQKFDLLSIE